MHLEQLEVCPICGGGKFTQVLSTKDFTVTRETFSIQKCVSCSFHITNPRPSKEEIGKYYQSDNYISHTGGNTSAIDTIYRNVRKITLQSKLNLVNAYQKKFNLLDYGSGTGQFLETCKDAGWTVAGVEPSQEARQKIRKDITVHSTLTEIKEQVNAITMWHVLEHVHELNETLARLRSLLTNNGTIFIAVPNHESPDAKHYGEFWAGYDVPRHLWHFNKENIKTLISRHNLKLLEIKPMKFDSYYVSMLSEEYKNPGKSKSARYFSASINGFMSNLKAGKDNYSSLIYIAGT